MQPPDRGLEPLLPPSLEDASQSAPRGMRRVQTFDRDGGDLDVYRRSLMPLEEAGWEEAEEGGPLIPPRIGSSTSAGLLEGVPEEDTFGVTTISLSKVILGSGMLVSANQGGGRRRITPHATMRVSARHVGERSDERQACQAKAPCRSLRMRASHPPPCAPRCRSGCSRTAGRCPLHAPLVSYPLPLLTVNSYSPPPAQVIPRAFQLLGVPIGVAVISFVGLLTWYTINGLVSGAEVGDGGRRNG